MRGPSVSLGQLYEKQPVTKGGRSQGMTVWRERVEKSILIATLDDVSAEINGRAKNASIEVYAFLPPDNRIREFSFVRSHLEYVLHIKLFGEKPTLTFLSRPGDYLPRNPFLRSFYKLRSLARTRIKMEFSQVISDESPSREEVEGWFVYLLSGLKKRFRPKLTARPVIGSGRENELLAIPSEKEEVEPEPSLFPSK